MVILNHTVWRMVHTISLCGILLPTGHLLLTEQTVACRHAHQATAGKARDAMPTGTRHDHRQSPPCVHVVLSATGFIHSANTIHKFWG